MKDANFFRLLGFLLKRMRKPHPWTLTETDPFVLTKRDPWFAREGIVSEVF